MHNTVWCSTVHLKLPDMYSSNSSLNGNNLTFSSNSPFCSFESNSTSSKDDHNIHSSFPLTPNFSFFQFPYSDPFVDNQLFIQQQHDVDFQLHHPSIVMNNNNSTTDHQDQASKNSNIVNSLVPAEAASGKGKTVVAQQIQRKRSSKRDRHSKIKTAKGLRDRRMRLSLEVAKRFFGLQDMLGFEKASKTVDWLLNQSKDGIKQLAREKNIHFPSKSTSSTSECEGVSSLEYNEVGNQEQEKVAMKKRRKGSNKVCRKSAFNSIGREKARERARERTKEKMEARTRTRTRTSLVDESNSKQCNEGRTKTTWNPFESVVESAGTQTVNYHPSFDHVKLINNESEDERISQKAKEHHSHSHSHEDHNSLFNMNKWSPTMFNSLNNFQEPQFEQFHQSLEKPWEGYNNNNHF